MRKIAKLLFSVLPVPVLLLVCLKSIAQDFSNKGKEFWIAYPAHIDGTGSVMGIYLTSDQNATGQVNAAGTIIPFTITANQVTRVFLGGAGNPTNTNVYLNMQDGIKSNAAIKITANNNIVVYTHIIRSARSGATLALPTPVLGIEYMITNYGSVTTSGATGNGAQGGISQFAVVATLANTVIEITPTANGIGGRPAGTPFQVTLANPGDCYQFQSVLLGDLSGTTIKSISSGADGCKPVAVFSGSTWTTLDCAGASGGDNLYQQLFPNRSWGKQFITAPFRNRPADIYRIFVQDPTTVVSYTDNGVTNTFAAGQYNANGKFYQYKTANPVFISADKPIQVVQYISSQNCKTGCTTGSTNATCFADPEMVVLNSIEQTLSDITFFSAHSNFVPPGQTNIALHYVNVIVSRNFKNTVRIDGALPAGAFIDIPGTNFSYLQEDLSASSGVNPVHRVTADTGFSAIVYGYGSVESYGYNGGTNVRDLYQYVSTKNQYATVNSPTACKSSPFIFSITLPYVPISIDWTIPGYPNYAVTNPLPDSTFINNGKQLYEFRIPNPYVYNVIGTYPIVVTINNPTSDGCAGIQVRNFDLQVFNPPTAEFTWNSKGCVDSAIAITTNNTTGGRPIIKHFWDFGDGTFAYTNNPTKTYTTPGTYTIQYSVLTDVGCISDTTKKTITVTRTPVAKFGFTNPQCLGKQITFGDTSTLAGGFGSIVNWKWDLGNGTILNNTSGSNVSTSYPSALTYTATLQVLTNSSCASKIYSLPVKINPNPVPDFTNLYACLPDGVVNFTGTSTIADGTQNLFSYLWNFGEASSGPLNTALIKDPSHKYASVGPFSVKLKVTSNNGCIDSIIKPVANVYPQPKSNFTAPAEICWQAQVTFRDASNGLTHPVDKWEWRFINSAGTVVGTSNIKDPVFVFPNPGTYTVKHWVLTNQNCISDTSEKTIVIHPWPTAANSLSTPLCEKNQVTILDNSTANVGTNVRWYWNLGDGTIINATDNSPINHTYTNWGDKLIKLVVENSKGCKSDTLFKTVRIHPLPKPGFILPEVCLRDAFAPFTDTTSIADGTVSTLNYLWNFNDGPSPIVPGPVPVTSTAKNNNIRYNISGVYQVSLKVTSLAGCIDSITKPFTVNGVISKTDYTILPANGLCSNQDIQIQNKTTGEFGWLTKVELFWDLANNPTVKETDDVPLVDEIYSHRYPNFQTPLTKTFDVRLRAYSGEICVSDIVKTITVNASPLTQFIPMPAICVDAAPRQITQARETGGLPVLSAVYSGPGVSTTGLFDPAAAGVGVHTIRYTFTATNGCSHFSEQTIEVWPRPVANLIAATPLCEKNAITFNSNGSVSNALNIAAWSWNFGDGTPAVIVANNNPVTHTYTSYGTYNVNLTVTNNRGCISLPQPLQVKVNALPRVDFSLPKVCLPAGTASFSDISTIPDNTQGLFTYRWDFGDGFANPVNSDTSLLKNPVYKYTNLGPYTVQLKVRSNNGCIDSLQKQLSDVFPQPKARFSSTKDSLCLGDDISFTDNSSGIVRDVSRWRWSFGNGDSSFIANPSYVYRSAGLYNVKLIVYSSEGCISDTATKQVNVWAYPNVNAGPDLTMLEEGIRRITDATHTGTALRYLWTPPTYLDNPRLFFPTIVRPKDDILYTFTVTGRGGCVSSDRVFVKVLKMPKPPNTFTPNGDGVNDFWEIKYLNDYPNCIVEIFNTVGTLVYRSVGYPTPWDGKWKGQALPAGTYYYVIDPKNGRARQSGYVTILK